jgi:hypothetical protein
MMAVEAISVAVAPIPAPRSGGLADRFGLAATQYGANGASDARNAAACRVKES